MPTRLSTTHAAKAAIAATLGITGSAATALLVVATWPQAVGLQRFHVLAQLVALRGLLCVAALGTLLVWGLIAWRSRELRKLAAAPMALLALVALVNVGILVARGFGGRAATDQTADITVFAWNTLWDRPGAASIASFALEHDVDVLALPETSRATAQAIAGLMAAGGRPMQVFVVAFSEVVVSQSTALLISAALGEYALDQSVGTTPRLPTVVARPASGVGPSFIAAHPVPPMPGIMRDWQVGLAWLAQRCREGEVIVAGDLNATLDHLIGLEDEGADLGACRDGAKATRSAALGTWPARLPPLLAAPIDHVMATAEWEFVEVRVLSELDGHGSDHRALLARLRRVR